MAHASKRLIKLCELCEQNKKVIMPALFPLPPDGDDEYRMEEICGLVVRIVMIIFSQLLWL